MFLPAPPPLPCRPPWWASGGHLQTILGNYLPGAFPDHPSAPFRIPLPDGDGNLLELVKRRKSATESAEAPANATAGGTDSKSGN